ncbi:PepSY-associated TM helix domain-containing protein [Ramlibacter pinisoli]|uniref:Peptidase n=1 Tax=Ramlibacter pinisoli TaxID=2682844 RepID=A0A6N8IWQ9_9BURK|nr:PepSY-associated TM helix domain-containing protein [Ramlibacter pinisoli]MBA2961148.1 PepSY-associated TM helix domain-containing protein [Ramlibacter sp. CGMCC 1.13660]MVQ31092.1 peptidase [Ramlibacter pinisoli]
MHSTIAPPAARPLPNRSVLLLAWLRKTHGWLGLWGATLGLLFGIAGIWLNHRAVLKLPMEQSRSRSELALPAPVPANATALAAWLGERLQQDRPGAIKVEPAQRLPWSLPGGAPAVQPEHWTVTFGGPAHRVQADYWLGNPQVAVTRIDSGLAATLANLHKGVGMPVGWILLVDTLAGSLIALCLSGVGLWWLMRRRRARIGLAILAASAGLTAALVASRL